MKTKITFALIAGIMLMNFFMGCPLEDIEDKITVTFDSGGNDSIAPVTLDRGGSLGDSYPTPAERTGFEFKGWYDGFTECTKNTEIYVDLTLVARWKETEFFTVTFNSNAGTPDFAPIMVPKGGTLSVKFPGDPRKQGFAFDKWLYDGDKTLLRDTPINANITATAQWRQLTEKFTVTFDVGENATPLEPIKVYAGFCIDEWEPRFATLVPKNTGDLNPGVIERAFKEWQYKHDDQNITYTGRIPVTADITLIAQWQNVRGDRVTIDLSVLSGKLPEHYAGNNYPLPTVKANADGSYELTFSAPNSAVSIATSEELRKLLLEANSLTVEVEGSITPSNRLFRLLIGNAVVYGEGWNFTKNHSPDPMIPFEQLKKKDLVIDETNKEAKPDDVNYVFIQTNRIGASPQTYDTPTVLTLKSITITVK